VALSTALNLLDSMDGLAAGVSGISALAMGRCLPRRDGWTRPSSPSA
jgi:UDP-N-acetylmuramyl pentapeptide phosphotransferase/UDP-N-acetylglucosamine-1-phosphate transferase